MQPALAAEVAVQDAALHLPPPPACLGPVALQPVGSWVDCGPWHCQRMLGEGGGGQIHECVLLPVSLSLPDACRDGIAAAVSPSRNVLAARAEAPLLRLHMCGLFWTHCFVPACGFLASPQAALAVGATITVQFLVQPSMRLMARPSADMHKSRS